MVKNVGNSVFRIELCMVPIWSTLVNSSFVASCFLQLFQIINTVVFYHASLAERLM
jgi:hypothetical protein